MNANHLIRMISRMVMNRGINHGINHMSRGGKRPEDITPEERERAKRTKGNAHRARQGLNIMRRFGRF
ncbi:hypothetical protein [Yoonia sp. 208BN28-4]|uniref:hypothetical protein n=1 Tax=Yoonia sp. 208BN28-4 TaxID=3126505 RepID=UPI0030B1AC4D